VSADAACGPPIVRSIIPDERILFTVTRRCKGKCAVGRRFSSWRAAAAWLLGALATAPSRVAEGRAGRGPRGCRVLGPMKPRDARARSKTHPAAPHDATLRFNGRHGWCDRGAPGRVKRRFDRSFGDHWTSGCPRALCNKCVGKWLRPESAPRALTGDDSRLPSPRLRSRLRPKIGQRGRVAIFRGVPREPVSAPELLHNSGLNEAPALADTEEKTVNLFGGAGFVTGAKAGGRAGPGRSGGFAPGLTPASGTAARASRNTNKEVP
jgi:hypothetical protein